MWTTERKPRYWRTALVYITLFVLLYFAVRNAPLADIWNVVRQLTLWQIATLLAINIAIYIFVTLRWWIIVSTSAPSISFLPLVLVRISVFGISYFTVGPQVGGEPLQVLYLQRNHAMTYTRATSTVIMDKLLEFLANFFLLVIGLTAIVEAGILSTNGSSSIVSLIVMAAIMVWPFIHIGLMMRGRYPVAGVLRATFSTKRKWVRFIMVAERMAGVFCQRNPRALFMSAGASLAAAACMIVEYALITSYLGVNLHGWQMVAAWSANWLSFLVPLPGGLGALEASQVFALGAFGVPSAMALGVAVLIRARDIFIGGLGLLLASRSVNAR